MRKKSKLERTLRTLLLTATAILGSCRQDISLDRAITLSSEAIRSKGYRVQEMKVEADQANSQWTEWKAILALDIGNPEEGKKVDEEIDRIERYDFYVVYFSKPSRPGAMVLDGDVFVFVDKHTGEVLKISPGNNFLRNL